MRIDPALARHVAAFQLPDPLGFGRVLAPVMFRADYADGAWDEGALLPYGPIALDPASKVLHYAQSVFEGLKAFRHPGRHAVLFRPRVNWARLNGSARRMCIPEIPEALFMDGLHAMAAACEPLIPTGTGQSLYLRPLVFGTEASLGLDAADSFSFIVIASPSDAVAAGRLRVVIEREGARTAIGGTGQFKVSGNYGASLHSTVRALNAGFNQPLWLDAAEHRYIEELSIMNFLAVIDGEIHTPELGDTILPGVTRDSLLELARRFGLGVHERPIAIDELLGDLRSGRCTEAFACGTAVIVAPIGAIGEVDGTVLELPEAPDPVALRLRRALLDIQEGRRPDELGWLAPVPAVD